MRSQGRPGGGSAQLADFFVRKPPPLPSPACGGGSSRRLLRRGLLGRAGGGAGDRLQRSGDDVAVHADAVEGAGAIAADLDKGGGLRVGPGADRVLMIV